KRYREYLSKDGEILLSKSRSAREYFVHTFGEAFCIERRTDFHIIIEINENVAGRKLRATFLSHALGILRFCSPSPSANAAGPLFERLIVVTAGIKNFRAVKTEIHEIQSNVHQPGPLHCIGTNKRDIIIAQHLDKFRRGKTCMPNLNGVPQGTSRVRLHCRS